MKILIFSQYYYPENFLINEIAEELVERGNEVIVLTGQPNYPSGKIYPGYKEKQHSNEIVNGVRIIRCNIIPRGHNFLTKFINYISYMISCGRKSKTLDLNPDIVFCYQLTPITQVYPAIQYCRLNNKKLVMYNLDLAPMSGSGTVIRKGILRFVYAWISKKIMNSCDRVLVSSKSFLDYNHYQNDVPYSKMSYLPQHAPKIKPLPNKVTNEKFCFMFAGNIGKGASLDTLVSAIRLLPLEIRNRISVDIVGDGSHLKALQKLILKNNLGNIFTFYGRVPSSEMVNYYKNADVLIVTLRKGQITIPSKLQMYMATGKLILGAMDGSGAELIKEAKCGICVKAEDYLELSKSIKSIVLNEKDYKECGINGKKYYNQNFTKEIFLDHLVNELNNVAKSD